MVVSLLLLTTLSWADLSVKHGKEVYQTNCLQCHGENLDGRGPIGVSLNPPPRNLVSDPFKKGEGADAIFAAISWGLPGTAMPAFEDALSKEDRMALVQYILSKRKRRG